MGSGKTTVARILGTHGYNRVAFATPLKTMLFQLLRLTYGDSQARDMLHESEWKERELPEFGNVTIRYMMQTLGTEWGRKLITPDLWVDAAMKQAQNMPQSLFVFDDVRFLNEYAAIRGAGGQIWRIIRPGVEATNNHPSERLLEDSVFDYQLVNGADFDALKSYIAAYLNRAAH